jgi:hypothetical protein
LQRGGLHTQCGSIISSRQLAVPMAAAGPSGEFSRQQPVILLDVMDTIVSDPFFEHMPRFFNLTFKVRQDSSRLTSQQQLCYCCYNCCSQQLLLVACSTAGQPVTLQTGLVVCSCFVAQELLAAKHPTAWVEFEKDQITQQQLFDKFFADRRQFDGQALIEHMVSEV